MKYRKGEKFIDSKGLEVQMLIPEKYFNKPCKNGCEKLRRNGSAYCEDCAKNYGKTNNDAWATGLRQID